MTLSATATSMAPNTVNGTGNERDIRIPPELIQYVDAGRNPDIYTREFVELARRGNQLMKGKQAAFSSFRDCLATEMTRGLPELTKDVERVVNETRRTWKGGEESQITIKSEDLS